MHHAIIAAFLDGTCPAQDFVAAVRRETPHSPHNIEPVNCRRADAKNPPVTLVTCAAARRIIIAMLAGELAPEMAVELGNSIIGSDRFDFTDELVALAIAYVADESRVHTPDGLRAALAELA